MLRNLFFCSSAAVFAAGRHAFQKHEGQPTGRRRRLGIGDRICLCTQRDGAVRWHAAPVGGFSAFMMISALVGDLLIRQPTIMFRRRYALKRMWCRARPGRRIPVPKNLSPLEADGDLRNLGPRRHDQHRLVVTPRRQSDVGRNPGRLGDGLHLTTLGSRVPGNSADQASRRFLP